MEYFRKGMDNVDNTDKLIDLLIGLKREICKKYYNGTDCYQVDCHDELHWCPMAYDGMDNHGHKCYHDFCQINDIINHITEE